MPNFHAFKRHLTTHNGGAKPHPAYITEQWHIVQEAMLRGISALNANASDATCAFMLDYLANNPAKK